MPRRYTSSRHREVYGLGVPRYVLKLLNAECIIQLVNARIAKIEKNHQNKIDAAILGGDLMKIEAAKATRDSATQMMAGARARLLRKTFAAAGIDVLHGERVTTLNPEAMTAAGSVVPGYSMADAKDPATSMTFGQLNPFQYSRSEQFQPL